MLEVGSCLKYGGWASLSFWAGAGKEMQILYTWSDFFVMKLNYSPEGLFSLLSLTLRIDSPASTHLGALGNVN